MKIPGLYDDNETLAEMQRVRRDYPSSAFIALLRERLEEFPPPKRSSRKENEEREDIERLLRRYRERGIDA